MPKIFVAKEVLRKILRLGFVKISQKGSHLKLKKGNKIVIIPIHSKDIPLGTFKSILEQANISYDEFLKIKKNNQN